MARYDRIARIEPPDRDDAFNGWFTLRDLEGREREPELGRRARLRYLALRPVRRLLVQGLDGPDPASLHSQVESVRAELRQLPAQDPDRQRLTEYLEEIGGRSPEGMVRATLEVGASAEAAGHRYAAEEFYTTALDLALHHDLNAQAVVALRRIGRVRRDREEWDGALDALRESAELAAAGKLGVEWARSMEGIAAVHLRKGDPDTARRTLDRLVDEAPAGDEGRVRAVAAGGRCALELVLDNPGAALEAGWEALTYAPATDEARNGVLLNMAAAFRRLGMHDAAASCYSIVVQWAAWPEYRTEARLELAVVAAESGDAELFADRRRQVLETVDRADRPLLAMIDLGLGRGALMTGDADLARDHLRNAIGIARDIGDDRILARSEELLTALEEEDTGVRTHPEPTGDARRIAEEITTLAGESAVSA
jgi:tetratricopeptide (TPR) repeat protein